MVLLQLEMDVAEAVSTRSPPEGSQSKVNRDVQLEVYTCEYCLNWSDCCLCNREYLHHSPQLTFVQRYEAPFQG
jgi:hypothetical protein